MPDGSKSNGHGGPMTTANPLTYPTSRLPFSTSTFSSPPSEYRGAPFWGWVTKQDLDKTVAQIRVFEEMGMGGFHMHTRVGLDIPYLGEEFMAIVKACVETAKQKGLSAFMYDEDRWPSGFAGGEVLEGHPELKGLHLLFTPWAYGEPIGYTKPTFPIANAAPVRSELGELVARYAIKLTPTGVLQSSRILQSSEEPAATELVWYAYAEPLPDSGFFGNQTLPDLLSADMTKRFIELTHERYKKAIGKDFGGTVPSIFTDEPQYCPMSTLNQSDGKQDVFLPWTRGIVASFKRSKGEDLVALLPWLVWDSGDSKSAKARSLFLDHVCDLFERNYVGELSKWCEANGVFCTGHMNAEPRLASQTAQNGEVMRCYRSMHLPGIDMLCDSREYNTAKQAASVSRQYGCSGVMSELYGVTGWDFTFSGHKGQGDWQAALGVTLRVHHLFWSTMRGEAKRDYPACIGYQSPWYKEYKVVEDHFARVNSALTRGKAVTRVAVIHPIESFWMSYGPKDRNAAELDEREEAFADLTKWLLFGHVDFDFVSESLFPELTRVDEIGEKLRVGECEYEAVILPNLKTIRSTTLERVGRFAKLGGNVIVAGTAPTHIDASPAVVEIPGATAVPWSKSRLLSVVESFRDIDMHVSETTLYRTQGIRADSLMYQLRRDGDQQYLFVCNTDREEACPVRLILRGDWRVEVLDTMTGKIWDIATERSGGQTAFTYYFDGCESLLARLSPGAPSTAMEQQLVLRTQFKQDRDVTLHSVTLSEPNALLLDYATHSLRGSPFTPSPEEVLRIDQNLRGQLGFFRKGAKIPQPWIMSPADRRAAGELRLRFSFENLVDVQGAKLALEDSQAVGIWLDGDKVKSDKDGWWVDEDIHTVPLPALAAGKHTLELAYQYGPLTNLERVYILGDFGVDVRGRTVKIVPRASVEWGDITRQGLPFYTGNVTYHCTFTSDGATPLAIRVANVKTPLVTLDLDGHRAASLIHEPFATLLDVLPAGEHTLDVTCYGNRQNAFGQVHLVPDKTNWLGADSWRSDFDWWSEEYVLGQVGVMNAPRIEVPGREVPKQTRRGKFAH